MTAKIGGDDITIVKSFHQMCNNMPEWFRDKDLQVIDSKFNEIVEQIKNAKNNVRRNPKNSAEAFSDFAGMV